MQLHSCTPSPSTNHFSLLILHDETRMAAVAALRAGEEADTKPAKEIPLQQ
eukprot:m.63020 g.63020  ORF g.63020 m.63020 type:complete len:51 (+) comp12445_c0_seq2:236-388(+)